MVVYIDPPKWPAHGTTFSHLVSDTSLEELHQFASSLNLPPRAFELDHYDVPETKYTEAVAAGAVPVSGRELIRILRRSGLRVPSRERPEPRRNALAEHWRLLMPGRTGLGAELIRRWSEPHRGYHGPAHLLDCLESVRLLAATENLASVPPELALAVWFHDAVYAAASGDDEERSAQLARVSLTSPLADEVARLVLLTKAHRTDPEDTIGSLLLDADLRILASAPQEYGRYVQGVRSEFRRYTDQQWQEGRYRVLAQLLERDHIFSTAWAQENWEARARWNIAGELRTMGG